MKKIGVPILQKIWSIPIEYEAKSQEQDAKALYQLGSHLTRLANGMYSLGRRTKDASVCCMRMALLLEELGELATALSRRNELEALDALADLDYVVQGCATAWDLPLDEAFWEVHRSNMTKGKGACKDGNDATNGKGADFSPPDLVRILHEHYNRE